MRIGNRDFDVNKHTYIWGILNVTPDSFSDGGQHEGMDAALFHAKRMIEEGADVIDIGGESTRPGYIKVSILEEIERTAPVIERMKKEFDVPVSIDTYKAEVAKAAVKAGADLLNDIWGLQTEGMAKVVKESGLPCCLMHNRKEHDYVNFFEDFSNDMAEIMERAARAGIEDEKIILDPGIGFCKTYEENLFVLNNMQLLNSFNTAWLLGCSRKSVIGNTLNLPVTERVEGTLATTAIAVEKGAAFVRVHDVKENKRLIQMLEAIRNA